MTSITAHKRDVRAWIPIVTGLVAIVVVVVPGMPELSQGTANAQAVTNLVVTGVATNHSSARVFFQPVAGARDYRVYDSAVPTNVKYAGLAHVTASASCPGPSCLNHFVALADGVTPVYPYRVAGGPTGGPQVLDGPATDIEWNALADGQPHTLVVEAVDQLGPVPAGNLYTGLKNVPLVNPTAAGAMLGSNKGSTGDGNISTNGQGPFTNRPQVIARSAGFVVQGRQELKAIPSSAAAAQSFYDTFESSEDATITQLSRQDSATDSFGNLGSKTYSMNAGTAREWTIEYRQADNSNSMPFVSSDHFMDMLFDGATPGGSAPTHTIYGSMSMTPRQTVDMSAGKAVHLTMEVDAHQSFRRWLAFELAPASDGLQAWDPPNATRGLNHADQALFLEFKDGGCTLDIFTGPTSATDPSPSGSAGGSAHGARLWGQAGGVGGAPIMCGAGELYNPARFSTNGFGLDDRNRFDFFVTQDHAALFEDGRLIVQSDIPAGTFPWANVPLKAYYSHYVYHSDADLIDLKTFVNNGAAMCYGLNAYWFNDPLSGSLASGNVCTASYPAGYGFPHSDERHWDNMGFEVWPVSAVPGNRDFSALAASVQPPQAEAPQFVGGVTPNLNPTPTPTPTPNLNPSPSPAPTLASPSASAQSTSGLPGRWVNISPAGVSTDFNNPPQNYGFNTIVTDKTQFGTVYLGTNYHGLYKSTNRGVSWAKIDTGPGSTMLDGGRIWALAIDPFNHNTLYAASGYGSGGPLKSTDGGVSWTQTLPGTSPVMKQIGTNDVYSVAVDPYTPNHILASFHYYWYGNQDSGVLESMDGGANWLIHNPPAGSRWGSGNAVWFLDKSQTWLLGSQSGGFWRTTSGGQSWTQVSTTNLTYGGIYSLYASPGSGTLYAAVWNGILKSTDNGVSWQTFASGLPYAQYDAVFGDGVHLYAAPSFPVIGGDNPQAHGPWYTVAENGGTRWTAFNDQTPCGSGKCNGPVQMAYDPVDRSIYSANWDSGVWRLTQE
jgi:hypothetical protein